MAIQSGNFSVPDASKYSKGVHQLIRNYYYLFLIYLFFNCFVYLGYMLEPDPEKRPDIFQVSAVAFTLMGKDNPVQNLNVSA